MGAHARSQMQYLAVLSITMDGGELRWKTKGDTVRQGQVVIHVARYLACRLPTEVFCKKRVFLVILPGVF